MMHKHKKTDITSKAWGLTGGIASGKSTAAQFLQEEGIPVVDADAISREMTAGKAAPLLVQRFGTSERKILREKAFSNLTTKKELETILHPLIQEESQKRIIALLETHPIVIYEAPLLIEAGRHLDFRGLIVVEAPLPLQMQRLLTREDMTIEIAKKVIESQVSNEDRKKWATHILKNSGSIDDLRSQVKALIPYLR